MANLLCSFYTNKAICNYKSISISFVWIYISLQKVCHWQKVLWVNRTIRCGYARARLRVLWTACSQSWLWWSSKHWHSNPNDTISQCVNSAEYFRVIELILFKFRIMIVILNRFDFINYFDDVELPLWIHIFIGVFICASILWTFLVLYGFVQFIYRNVINGVCSSKNGARIQALKSSLGITKNSLSIGTDGANEISHTYTHISMRKPCEHIEKFEIRNQKRQ